MDGKRLAQERNYKNKVLSEVNALWSAIQSEVGMKHSISTEDKNTILSVLNDGTKAIREAIEQEIFD